MVSRKKALIPVAATCAAAVMVFVSVGSAPATGRTTHHTSVPRVLARHFALFRTSLSARAAQDAPSVLNQNWDPFYGVIPSQRRIVSLPSGVTVAVYPGPNNVCMVWSLPGRGAGGVCGPTDGVLDGSLHGETNIPQPDGSTLHYLVGLAPDGNADVTVESPGTTLYPEVTDNVFASRLTSGRFSVSLKAADGRVQRWGLRGDPKSHGRRPIA